MRSMKVLSLAIVATLTAAVAAGASPGSQGRPALPPGAVKIAEDTYALGKRSWHGVEVEGIAFVYRAKTGQGTRKSGGSCFAYLASGAKWRSPEPWSVDESGAPVSGMAGLMTADVGTWESAAGANIFGDGKSDSSYDAVTTGVDGRSGAEFGPIADADVIAVTYTWGVFGGPPKDRELVEWDMVFDSDTFAWSATGAPDAMDFRSIDTHELGHAMGLGHPASTCTEETMYAYASLGETKKRDLNAGDIVGIAGLY